MPFEHRVFTKREPFKMAGHKPDNIIELFSVIGAGVQRQLPGPCGHLAAAEWKRDPAGIGVALRWNLSAKVVAKLFQVSAGLICFEDGERIQIFSSIGLRRPY